MKMSVVVCFYLDEKAATGSSVCEYYVAGRSEYLSEASRRARRMFMPFVLTDHGDQALYSLHSTDCSDHFIKENIPIGCIYDLVHLQDVKAGVQAILRIRVSFGIGAGRTSRTSLTHAQQRAHMQKEAVYMLTRKFPEAGRINLSYANIHPGSLCRLPARVVFSSAARSPAPDGSLPVSGLVSLPHDSPPRSLAEALHETLGVSIDERSTKVVAGGVQVPLSLSTFECWRLLHYSDYYVYLIIET